MSFRILQFISSSILLVVILFVVVIAIQNSNKSIHYLSHVADVHTPVLDGYNNVMHLMHKTESNILSFQKKQTLKASDLIKMASSIENEIKKMYLSSNKDLLAKVINLKKLIAEYSQVGGAGNSDAFLDIDKKILSIKFLIRKSYQSLNNKNKKKYVGSIKIISNLINSMQLYVSKYIQQEELNVNDVVRPLDKATKKINSMIAQVSSDEHEDLFNVKNIEVYSASDDLIKIKEDIKALIQSIHIYSEEKIRMDPSASQVTDSLDTVHKVSAATLININKSYDVYRKYVLEEQSSLVSESRSTNNTFVAFLIIGLLLSVVGVVYINRVVNKDLDVLIKGTHKFANSNFAYDFPVLKLKELNSISENFNMIAKYISYNNLALRNKMTELDKANNIISNSKKELEQKIEERTSELKVAMEEAKKSDLAKSSFLANMSHELRTPLHGILSFAKFGIDKSGSASLEKILGYFSNIDASGKRLKVLLDDLLDLSKLESGKMTLSITQVNLFDVINECVAEQNAFIKSNELEVKIADVEGLPRVECDRNRIGQIIMNLLSNAIKFSPPGGKIDISGRTSQLQKNKGGIESVQISFSDNGKGIPEKDLKKIFRKFVQSDNNEPSSGGTGLGLAITKELMLAHNGDVWCQNNKDEGVTFYFELPIVNNTMKVAS